MKLAGVVPESLVINSLNVYCCSHFLGLICLRRFWPLISSRIYFCSWPYSSLVVKIGFSLISSSFRFFSIESSPKALYLIQIWITMVLQRLLSIQFKVTTNFDRQSLVMRHRVREFGSLEERQGFQLC